MCVCVCVCVLVAQSCSTLCDTKDYSLPGSSVWGILQARIPEWVAILFSRGSSWPRDGTWSPALQADSLPSEPSGKPKKPSYLQAKPRIFVSNELYTLYYLLPSFNIRQQTTSDNIIPWFHVVELTARKQQMMWLIISNFALQILLKFYYLCFAFKNLYP